MEVMNDALIVVQDEPYAKVTYSTKYNLGILIWKGQCSSEQYRNTFQSLMNYQKESVSGVSHFISDIRDQAVISPEDRKWFENVALPTAKNQGLKKAATVISGNIFKQYYVNILLSTAKNFGFPLKVFKDWDEAIKWVLDDNSAQVDHSACS